LLWIGIGVLGGGVLLLLLGGGGLYAAVRRKGWGRCPEQRSDRLRNRSRR